MRPTYEGGIALDALGVRHRAMRMRHYADTAPGQSGGPFFGLWDDAPYVVAVQAASYNGLLGARNFASGGRLMTNAAWRANEDYP